MTDRDSKAGHDRDIAPNIDELILRMEASGYHFLRFEAACEDPCLPVDVEWNYKDLVHVGYVHSHMSRQFVFTAPNIYTTIDLQKVLGVTVPQSGVFYVTADNRIVVHTTLFLYVIFVEIRSAQTGEMTTLTQTRYGVGSRSRFLQLFAPLIRYGIRRNWSRFTQDDRSLRRRRGALRKQGFTFADTSPIDHLDTLDIRDNGVFPPVGAVEERVHEVVVAEAMNKVTQLGDADHLGLQVSVEPHRIRIFPRLCPHRGASLDDHACSGPTVACPWHGRIFRPVAEIANDGSRQLFEGPLHRCEYDGEKLTIRVLPSSGIHRGVDWTAAWTPVSEAARSRSMA